MSKKKFISVSPKMISSDKSPREISEKVSFPCPICLEYCQMDVTRGYYDDVLKTLKAFSTKELYDRKNPHALSKDNKLGRGFDLIKKLNANQVLSLDIKDRHDNKRLFYCFDKVNRAPSL